MVRNGAIAWRLACLTRIGKWSAYRQAVASVVVMAIRPTQLHSLEYLNSCMGIVGD